MGKKTSGYSSVRPELPGAPDGTVSQGDFCSQQGTTLPPSASGFLLFWLPAGDLLVVPHPVIPWSSCATSALQSLGRSWWILPV